MQKNFMGRNGFTWFVGVVEDRNDPQFVGRVRVRCLGLHTADNTKLPTSDLPCQLHPMNPITSATVSGVGQTPLGLIRGHMGGRVLSRRRRCSATYRYGDFAWRSDTGVA